MTWSRLHEFPRRVARRVVRDLRNWAELPATCGQWVRYRAQHAPAVLISDDVWRLRLFKLLGMPQSIHGTGFAHAENQKLMPRFARANGTATFAMYPGVNLRLPKIPDVEHVAVNDLREILAETIYEHDAVRIRPGDVVLDCGANIGVFSLLAMHDAGSEGRLISVEPVPEVRALLQENLAHSGLPCPFIIEPRPVSKNVSDVELILSDEAFTMHHFHNSEDFLTSTGRRLKLQTVPIDQLVVDHQLTRLDFIKMDIEGAEMDALQGAAETLRRWKPRLAISAYHRRDDFYKIPALIARLNPEYTVHVLRGLSPMCYAW